MRVPVKLLHKDAKIPKSQTEGSACMDLHAIIEDRFGNNYMYLPSGDTKIIKTGLAVEVPEGYELQIRPRSGLASQGVVVSNSPGTIDSDYRGEIGVILTNNSDTWRKITSGDRIAQCKIEQVIPFEFYECSAITETERGEGGFGHTGN